MRSVKGTRKPESCQQGPQSIVKAAPSKVLAIDVGIHHSYLQAESQASVLLMALDNVFPSNCLQHRAETLHQLKVTRIHWS